MDGPLRAVIFNNVGVSLYRLTKAGAVRKIIEEPEKWWELAG